MRMCTANMAVFTLFAIVAFVYGVDTEAIGDQVVPETMPEALTQIPDAYGIVDHFGNEVDHELLKHATADSEGNNPVTGQAVTKTSNGMKDEHLRTDTTMGRKYVKNPGYTPDDSRTSLGKHYYLGSGRRRVGAGFGRRRAPVQMANTEDEKAYKKHYKKALKSQKFMAKLNAMAHNMASGFNSKTKEGSKAIKLTKKEVKALAEEILGLKSGASFYSGYNYKGTSLTKSSSISKMSETQITNDDLSSLKVPKGWCVTLFTRNKFTGQSHKFCATLKGPTKVWNLQKYPLTLHYNNIRAKDFTSKKTTSLHTTWNNQVSSVGVTKFHYVRHEPPQKCVTTCGVREHVFVGKVTCLESHFREKKKTVDNKNCKAVGLRMPRIPMKGCPATAACVNYKTRKSTVTCAKCCGFRGKTYHGKVWCEVRDRVKKDGKLPSLCFPGTKKCTSFAITSKVPVGKHVGDSKCMHWNLAKPDQPAKPCAKTPACTAFETKTPRQLGKSCPTQCGAARSTLTGSSFCKETGFNANADIKVESPSVWNADKKTWSTVVQQRCSKQSSQDKQRSMRKVSDSKCHFWQQSKPAVPTQGCPAINPCTVYVAGPAGNCPGKSCGQAANTETGSVYCKRTQTGAIVPDAECNFWGHTKPAPLSRYCAGGSRCCGQAGKCAGDCCTYVARWAAKTNSCANCPFGNHHVYPGECDSSRKCDMNRL